jgi:hypothetical protein
MAVADEHPARIPPGDILRLFEELGIRSGERDGSKAAQVQFANYVSNRSVALILRPHGGMYVGSGVCFRIGNRSFVATAAQPGTQGAGSEDFRFRDPRQGGKARSAPESAKYRFSNKQGLGLVGNRSRCIEAPAFGFRDDRRDCHSSGR